MKRKFLVLIISLFATAAISLIIIQIVQTRRATEISNTLFNISVDNAMDEAIGQLEQDQQPRNKPSSPNYEMIDSTITESLIINGVDIDHEVAILNAEQQMLYCTDTDNLQSLVQSDYRYTYTHKNRKQYDQYYICLIFPTHGLFLRQNSSFFIYISVFLLAVITVLFLISIRVISNQRKLDEMKTDFISNMTHEIKTPIATISLACELLQDTSVSTDEGQRQNYLSVINEENRRMRVLIETILQSSKMGNKNFSLNLSSMDLNHMVGEVARDFNLPISKRQGELRLNLCESPTTIVADALHMSNCIHNLIDNAIKYSDKAPSIDITTRISGRNVVMSIADQGIGISKEDQKHIFEKFYRVSSGNVHNVKGFGIGLNYVYQVVKLHSGTIALQSDLGNGSTFTITLPSATTEK